MSTLQDIKLSVIIPTLNEAERIGGLVKHLRTDVEVDTVEIIVVDGGSRDHTRTIAASAGATVLQSPQRGRAVQMNFAAARSRGAVLYFIHADCLPPNSFFHDIQTSIQDGFPIGCYRFRFASHKMLLKINAWFTRFNLLFCRGGDQSLYVTKTVFEQLGGFCTKHVLMEDYEFVSRAQKNYPFKIIPKEIVVSARKYDTNSYLRVQFANFTAFNMYRLGFSPKHICKTYRRLINYR